MAKLPKPEELAKDRLYAAEDKLDGHACGHSRRACSATARSRKALRPSASRIPRDWRPADADWKLPENWKADPSRRDRGPPEKVPVLPAVHGHLRALRRLRGQVPFLHRHRRPQEHAGAPGRADPVGLPKRIHRCRQDLRQDGRRTRTDARCAEGVVVLLLPVH